MENYKSWIEEYFQQYKDLTFSENLTEDFKKFYDLVKEVQASNNKLMFAGNGASASISGHAAVDFTKQGKTRSLCFNEAGLITCFANDYGYEEWVARAIDFYGEEGDVVVLISCSGKSPNVVRAAEFAKQKGYKVVTFTGHAEDNPLKSLGDINFWVDSKAYNIIECIHMIWITVVVDMMVGKAEYSVV